MSRETIWLIIAGAAALIGVPMLYMGLQESINGLVLAGFCLFTFGMVISPVMRITHTRKAKAEEKEESVVARRA